MKKAFIFGLCLAASIAFGQFMFGPNGQAFQCLPAVSGGGGGTPFYPTNIPGMAYFWNYKDVGNTNIAIWTDEINHTNLVAGTAPTNTIYGVYFNNSRLINSGIVLPDSLSFWAVIVLGTAQGSFATLLTDDGRNVGFGLRSSGTKWSDAGTANWSDAVATTDFLEPVIEHGVWANGQGYTNGVAALATSAHGGTIAVTSMGQNSIPDAFQGHIQYLGIWTNTTLSAANQLALYNWANTNDAANVQSGLLARWRLDENTGTTFADSSGNGWSGYLTNQNGGAVPTWTNGVINSALSFSGNQLAEPILTNFCVIPNSATLTSNLSAITISCWLKGTAGGAAGNWQSSVVSKQSQYLLNDYRYTGWQVVFDDSAVSAYFVQSNANLTVDNIAGQQVTLTRDGFWHQFVAVKDSTGTNLLEYLDGFLWPGSASVTGVVTNWSNNLNVQIGWDGTLTANHTDKVFPGCIDDVRIYNRELSGLEIYDLYKWGVWVKQ